MESDNSSYAAERALNSSSAQGLLGHSPETKKSDTFKPVDYDHTEVKFEQLDFDDEHVMAID